MANPHSIIGIIKEISPSVKRLKTRDAERYEEINFQDGKISLLDKTDPKSEIWSDILHSSYQSQSPVYVEIDPNTQVITEFLLPMKVKVAEISPIDDTVKVELFISQAHHYLKRSNPDFASLLEILQNAKEKNSNVLVTENHETHEIINVQPSPNNNSTTTELLESPSVPISPFAASVVTIQKANELFKLVNSTTCSPIKGTAPCIPFLYPDDGCWGRAHEMCRLLLKTGVVPQKVWIYGNLRVATKNNPLCEVRWGWHVAPTLRVHSGSGSKIHVIDPSCFTRPVTQTQWVNIQGDPSPMIVVSDVSVFHRSRNGNIIYDDNSYTQTKRVLDTYRNYLKLRSVSSSGPPPYSHCITT